MADLDRIITVNISRVAAASQQASYNGILIASEFLMSSWTVSPFGSTERVRIYTSLAAMAADGCPTTSFAYLAAAKVFAQNPAPTQVFIGRKLTGADGTETWAVALAAMAAVATNLAAWYCVVANERVAANQQVLAQWIESNKKMAILASSDAGIVAATTTDIAYYLKTNNLTRTMVIYHPNADGTTADVCPDAALAGVVFVNAPGSITLAYKTLNGVASYQLSGSQISNILGKYGTFYSPMAGVNITQMGQVGSGEFFDVIWGIDWMQSQIQSNIYNALLAQGKIPYTDGGIDTVASCLRSALQSAVNAGILASFTITVPLAASISGSVKGTRNLPGVSFTAVLAGAIHTTTITGVVTY